MNVSEGMVSRFRRLGHAKLVLTLTLVSLASQHAAADVITQWNFNVNSPGTNNNPNPSTGAGSASIVGLAGTLNADFPTAANGIGSSDPAVTPDLSWRVRAMPNNGWSGTVSLLSGAQFSIPTVGFTGITLSLDINATDGSPRYAQLQYTTDGANFTSFGSLFDFKDTNDNWANALSRDLSSVAGVNNNPNFGFKIVTAFSPVEFTDLGGFHAANTAFEHADADPLEGPYTGAAGNYRFDMITVSGIAVPEPSSLVLISLSALFGSVVVSRKRVLPR